ncbi:MAG: hypothetical protein NVSMB18_23510 [Acetobacteraceae bacterium]
MHTDANGLYAILDIAPTASEHVIRKAYRRRAKQLHPDVNPDCTSDFIALKRAYDTLANPAARAEYDRACSIPIPRPAPGAPPFPTPPARRPRATTSYGLAFALMTAFALLALALLVSFTGPPPIPDAPLAAAGDRPSRAAKSGDEAAAPGVHLDAAPDAAPTGQPGPGLGGPRTTWLPFPARNDPGPHW